jgi:hypothetical protein
MKKQFSKRFLQFLIIAFLVIPGLLSFGGNSQEGTYGVMISPPLSWHTFLGSTSSEGGYAIALDGSGNICVVGEGGATWGTPINPYAGATDTFVVKLDNDGTLLWNTFMGSAGFNDSCSAVAIDGDGNIYVVGTSYDTWGTPINAHIGLNDVFVAKLNSSGVLQWHTFLGSPWDDGGAAVAVDGSGNVYVAGDGFDWGTPINPYTDSRDAFVVKLNSSGVLQWNTFLGSVDYDYCMALTVDGSGNILVAGTSNASWGTPVTPHAGNYDAFAAKLNSGGAFLWNTFLGATAPDVCSSIAVDGSGNVYVAGSGNTTWGSPVNPHEGGNDTFAAKLNSNGVLQWNTFMGSITGDFSSGIAVDGSGNVYISGTSKVQWGWPGIPYVLVWDAFLAQLNNSGVRQWNTFLGSESAQDGGAGIAVDGSGNVYMTGNSRAAWGTPLNPFAGINDAFVAKFGPDVAEPEINVRFGGINFADGSTRNLGTRTSSFIMGREFTFAIENLGGASLNLTGSPAVTLSGPQAAHFYISQQPSSPVAAYDSTTFKLRTVRDSLPGVLPIGWTYAVSITVNIPNDDANENPYTFTINFTLEKDI